MYIIDGHEKAYIAKISNSNKDASARASNLKRHLINEKDNNENFPFIPELKKDQKSTRDKAQLLR